MPLLLFGVILGTALVNAQSLVTTRGPFIWTEPETGGQVSITLRVYADIPEFPSMYKWDYAIHNVSLHLPPSPETQFVDGVGEIRFALAEQLTELQILNAPDQWWS